MYALVEKGNTLEESAEVGFFQAIFFEQKNVRCKFSPCLTPRELQTLLLRAGFGAKIMRKNLIERTEDLPFRRTE